MYTIKEFENDLRKQGLADNTVKSYLFAVNYFNNNYQIELDDLLSYKGYLIENYKPKTVNLRLQALNSYLRFLGKTELCLKTLKIQQKNHLDDVISYADYLFLKRKLKMDNNLKWYFIVSYLGATGARVSELIKLKIEHVEIGL